MDTNTTVVLHCVLMTQTHWCAMEVRPKFFLMNF